MMRGENVQGGTEKRGKDMKWRISKAKNAFERQRCARSPSLATMNIYSQIELTVFKKIKKNV